MDLNKINWLLANSDVQVTDALKELMSKLNRFADEMFQQEQSLSLEKSKREDNGEELSVGKSQIYSKSIDMPPIQKDRDEFCADVQLLNPNGFAEYGPVERDTNHVAGQFIRQFRESDLESFSSVKFHDEINMRSILPTQRNRDEYCSDHLLEPTSADEQLLFEICESSATVTPGKIHVSNIEIISPSQVIRDESSVLILPAPLDMQRNGQLELHESQNILDTNGSITVYNQSTVTNEGCVLNGNPLFSGSEFELTQSSDANVSAGQHVTGEVDDADTYELDDMIDYDPVSDDDEEIDEEGHQMQIDKDQRIHDELDRNLKNPGSRVDAIILSDGTLQEEVKSGPVCEPPEQNFKSGSCDKTLLLVDTSDGSATKKNCCPYCFTLQSKFARHIELHKEELEVQSLMKLDKGSDERKKALDVLRKRGNHRFNTDTKINTTNKMIVSRRPNSKLQRTGKEFRACAFCLGTYSATSTRQHICSGKAANGDRSLINLSRMVEGRWHEEASKALQTAMSGLNEDATATLVKYDRLLIMFGNSFCETLDTLRQQKLVRQQLRILGRLLVEVKKIEATVTDFASIFQTQFVDPVISAIRVIGRFNSTSNYFKSPSPATNLVTLVKQVGRLLLDDCIETKNKQLKEQTDDFIALFTSRSFIKINKLAAKSRAKMMLERVETMPSTEEICQFQEFVNRRCDEYCDSLNAGSFPSEKEFSKTWIKLAGATLVSIMVFNRRRVGDMQLCEVSHYINRQKIEQNSKDLLFATLSEQSKKRVLRYSRMALLAKRHVPVAVLLNSDIEKRIDVMLKFREAAGVPSKNNLLFALPSSFEDKPRIIDACAVLRKLTLESGVDNPKDIRGTKMRKHFANFCAMKGINDNTLNDVANFMGHNPDVHRKSYRGNALDRQVARISELLEESSGQSVPDVINTPIMHVARKKASKARIEKGHGIGKKCERQLQTQRTDTNRRATVDKKQSKTQDMTANGSDRISGRVNNKRKNTSAQSNPFAGEREAETPTVTKKRKISPKPVELDSTCEHRHAEY